MDTLILCFIGLVGLGLLVSTVALFRDYGRRGFLSLAAGLGLLAAAVFWLPAYLVPAGDTTEVRRLQAELDASRAKTKDAELQMAATAAKLSVETIGKQTAETRLSEDLTVIGQDVDKLQQKYSDPESSIYLNATTVSSASASQAEPSERLQRIRDTLGALADLQTRAAFVPEPPQRSQAMDETRALISLKDQMSTRLETKNYDVELYPERELVGGRQGKYYVIDLKDAANGIRYYFEGGKYSLARGNAEFRSSLNAFIADVLKKIDGKVRYDLFVRGSADAKPYQGRMERGLEYPSIALLRHAGNDRYASQPSELQLASTIKNEDLPNLRAAFMRDVVAENYPVKRPMVLEGAVSAKPNDRDRNVELILFVDW